MDAYSKLPQSVNAPLPRDKKDSKVVNKFLEEVLPSKRLNDEELEKIRNMTQTLQAHRKKWAKTASARRRNWLSYKDRRKLKLLDIKKEGQKYTDYVPLHNLWRDYMQDLLDFERFESPDPNHMRDNNERLLKADYHGCLLVVRRSKCPSLIGTAGIVLMDTRNTFKIITREDKIKCLPKENSVFVFELRGFLFTIYGNQFKVKASERVRKRFKQKPTIDF